MTDSERIEQVLAEICTVDGADHKQWMLDQIVRILTDCPMKTATYIDVHGKEHEYQVRGQSEAYKTWLTQYKAGEDGPDTYDWDEGFAP
jgi:hypothetical protein